MYFHPVGELAEEVADLVLFFFPLMHSTTKKKPDSSAGFQRASVSAACEAIFMLYKFQM